MTFFCAKCQKRHDVRDISADMWSICRENLRDAVKKRVKELIDGVKSRGEDTDDLTDLYNDLLGFLYQPEPRLVTAGGDSQNTWITAVSLEGGDTRRRDKAGEQKESRINAYFALNLNNLRRLTNARMENDKAEGGIVTGTFSISLGSLLLLYARWEDAQYSTGCVPGDWYSVIVYEQEIKAYFTENGVLDKVTDPENVPFAQDGRMLGFTHICPHCGLVLSRASGAAEEIVVALAGSPRAGKTACMVAMLSSLLNGVCPGIRIIPMAHDEKWNDLSVEIDYFNRNMKVEKTPDKITDVPSHSILIQMNDKEKTRRVLTIVDMPGEFWQGTSGLTGEFFRQYSGIYNNIDCIWFVITKATICLSQASMIPQGVQEDLLDKTSEDAGIIKDSSPQNLSINLSTLRGQLQRPLPPVMVIVSKPDYSVSELDLEKTREYKLFPMDSMDVASSNAEDLMATLKTDSHRLYGISQYPMYEHAANVRAFIEDTCPSFLSAIEDNCSDRFYTTLSPYGHPALDRDSYASEAPTPYHELYPFVWTLAIQGGLKVYQDCVWLKKNFLGMQVSEEHTKEQVTFSYTKRNLPVPAQAGKKEKQRIQDINQVYAAISNNLLMNGRKYISETVIHHERE